jgi:hypothetical protein
MARLLLDRGWRRWRARRRPGRHILLRHHLQLLESERGRPDHVQIGPSILFGRRKIGA